MKKIAIIGANGYVGNHLLQLLAKSYEVYGIVHSELSIYKPVAGISYFTPSDIPDITFDVIINTAYSASPDIIKCRKDNIAMLELIRAHMDERTNLIHLSTLAVFGILLDLPIAAQPLPDRIDYPYVVSKLDMENRLLEQIPHRQLQIIRIGNIWGAANASWTQRIADAVTFGTPVKYTHKAFSNITYIHNLTDYIGFLVSTEKPSLLFHHMAELSSTSWQYIIDEIGEELGISPVTFDTIPQYPAGIYEQLNMPGNINPLDMYRNLKHGRFTSFGMTQLIRKFPGLFSRPSFLRKNKNSDRGQYHIPADFLWILSCQKEFRPVLNTGWKPPFTAEEAMINVKDWMKQAGYLKHPAF